MKRVRNEEGEKRGSGYEEDRDGKREGGVLTSLWQDLSAHSLTLFLLLAQP